jgi:lipoate-protein ligase A
MKKGKVTEVAILNTPVKYTEFSKELKEYASNISEEEWAKIHVKPRSQVMKHFGLQDLEEDFDIDFDLTEPDEEEDKKEEKKQEYSSREKNIGPSAKNIGPRQKIVNYNKIFSNFQ